jgi:L-rhamnose mutarotase
MDYGCLTFKLRAGREEEYKRRHAEVWTELEEALRNEGFKKDVVFIAGSQVVVYLEHPDNVSRGLERIAEMDVNRRWSEYFSDLMFEEPVEAELVWYLS